MAHTYASCLFHVVFSTKERRPLISPAMQARLWGYLGGIARKNRIHALAIGGTADHIHMLLAVPPEMPLAKALQLIKGGSSKWVHETYPSHRLFAWQEGYGAFSISISHLKETIRYIEEQEEHHRRKTFQEEFLAFLKKHNLDFDPRYVWG